MSCNKCEGQVRYDPTKKILLYKWGCDWLPLPNSALGSLPDAPPPGDDELPDLPDLPDGDSSQNYACRKAVVIMSVIYEKASEILTYATENNFTDFVKKVGLGNTTDVSRSLKAIYDAQLDPVTFALYTDYIANENILTDHICAVSNFLSKTPGLTDSEYDQISDYIDSLASLARNILRLAKARLSLVEANRMAQAAAFDESVPCPCGQSLGDEEPEIYDWYVDLDLKNTLNIHPSWGGSGTGLRQFKSEGNIAAIQAIWESGIGFKEAQNNTNGYWGYGTECESPQIPRIVTKFSFYIEGSPGDTPSSQGLKVKPNDTGSWIWIQQFPISTRWVSIEGSFENPKIGAYCVPATNPDQNTAPSPLGSAKITRVKIWGNGTNPFEA